MRFSLVLILMGSSALMLTCVQAFWLHAQYQQYEQDLYRDAQKSLSVLNQELNSRNSFVSRPGDQNTYDFQTWSADSSQLFIFASNVSEHLVLPDSMLQRQRREAAQALADQVFSSPGQEGIFETILLRSIQQCANCNQHQSLGEMYPLDELLAKTLHQQGITLPFAAGLLDIDQEHWNHLYLIPDADSLQLAASTLNLTLMGEVERLYLYFPGQRSWIIRQLWLQVLVSLLLLLIIFSSFYYAWRIISQQKKLSEMKNDFINNMTHELKTPIATIAFAVANIDNAQIIQHPDLIRPFTKIIYDENRRLNSQVEKVLNSAVSEELLVLNWESIPLSDFFMEITSSVNYRIEELGGVLRVELASVKGKTWVTDPVHLSSVINNLLDNAIKYAGSKPPAIELVVSLENRELFVQVKDQGIGIHKEDLPFVFDKFYRAHTGNLHNVKGFGLGLSYVQQIVQRMEGKITAKSEPGKGSTFLISLPPKTLKEV